MTAKQAAYLRDLCRKAGEQFDPTLTKARASARIDELTGRLSQRRAEGAR